MARLIDADALHWRMGVNQDDEQIFYVTGEDIDAAPAIDPESLRPTAHWEGFQADGKDDRFEFTLNAINICSKCKHISMQKSKYCPHCGCFMENKNGGSYVKK